MKKIFAVMCLAFGCMAVHAATPAETEKVLRQLDAASQRFHTATAEFTWTQTMTRPVFDEVVQKGNVVFQRDGAEMEMAAHILTSDGKPMQKDLVYSRGELKMYEPLIKQLSVYTAGANRGMYESFLTLGFGGSGSDLSKGWTVNVDGHEKMDGIDVVRLKLVSKSESVRSTFTNVILWVDADRGVSLKQQFFEKDGNSRTAVYSRIVVNAKLRADTFTVKPSSGTKTIQVNK